MIVQRIANYFARWRAPDAPRPIRRIVVLSVGCFVLLLGALISPLPGPGLTILGPVGLAILATEFLWARHALKHFDHHTKVVDRHAPWLAGPLGILGLVLVVAGYWVAAYVVIDRHFEHGRLEWMLAGFGFIPISLASTVVILAARRRWLAARETDATIDRSVGE